MDRDELAFTYFPDNYRWSHGLLLALGAAPWGGGEIGEINRVGLRLAAMRSGDDRAWFDEWARMAERVETVGRERAASGKAASAAAYLFRAAHYYHVGERFLVPKTADGLAAYKRGVDCFRDGARRARRPRIEPVEVPYEGTSLPALFVHAEGGARRSPALVFFDGFDVTKEIQYFKGVPDLVARGIACLIVDGPGNGEAIRFRNLPLHHETERDATLKRLEGFRLDGVVQRIRCPFLLVHGEGDAQIPLATAQKCFGAVGSTRKTFKVFTREEGGYHHCQSDNVSIGTAYMWDWLAEVFAM